MSGGVKKKRTRLRVCFGTYVVMWRLTPFKLTYLQRKLLGIGDEMESLNTSTIDTANVGFCCGNLDCYD